MASIRITKTMAENAADVMAKKAYDYKIKKIEQELTNTASKLASKYIPAPVLACAKEYGDYMGTSNNVVVRHLVTKSDGTTTTSGWINSNTNIPVPHSCCYIMADDNDFSLIDNIEKKRLSTLRDKDEFRNKVCGALVSLRTVKRVEEDFPEAVKFIDIPVEKSLPSPVLSDIRSIVSLIS